MLCESNVAGVLTAPSLVKPDRFTSAAGGSADREGVDGSASGGAGVEEFAAVVKLSGGSKTGLLGSGISSGREGETNAVTVELGV